MHCDGVKMPQNSAFASYYPTLIRRFMRLITVAIHTYDRALAVKSLLESEGINVILQNVNLEQPEVASGVRLRIAENNLPLALRIIENPDLFGGTHNALSAKTNANIHNIVVPIDFSDYSYLAAKIAVRIAAAHKVDLTFLHAYIDPHISSNLQLSDNLTYEIASADAVEQLIDSANGEMAKFERRIKDEMKSGALPVVRFSHVISEGVPEDAIISYAKDNTPYLVVMGTRSASTKEKDMIGSVTAEVLDESRFSVLTIPENLNIPDYSAPKNILFFSNLDQEDILAMDTLYRYFAYSHSRVTIVHIPNRHSFIEKDANPAAFALSDYCAKKFDQYTFENIPMSPKNAIVELEKMQKKRNFDLIVVPNRRKNVLTRMFNPGIAHRLLFHADIPMLVIPV